MRDYEYIVKEGDKPSVIAQRLVRDSSRWQELMSHNTIFTPNKWVRHGGTIVPVYHLRVGQRLYIPNYWIKDIDNQLIHTTQGQIGYSESDYIPDSDSIFYNASYSRLKELLGQLEPAPAPFHGEVALYFCDERLAKDFSNAPGAIQHTMEYPSGGTNVSDCANNAMKWLLGKGGIFKFLPGNWRESLDENEIMERINKAKEDFKKIPVILKKTQQELGEIWQIFKDGYYEGYNIGYKQDGPNSAQAVINGEVELGQYVTYNEVGIDIIINTSDIPVTIPQPYHIPNMRMANDLNTTDVASTNTWIAYWKQGWTDGYTDGFREALDKSDYGKIETTQDESNIIGFEYLNYNLLNDMDLVKEKNTDNSKFDGNKPTFDSNKSEDTFPWGYVIFSGLVLVGGGVGYYYYNKKKQERSL